MKSNNLPQCKRISLSHARIQSALLASMNILTKVANNTKFKPQSISDEPCLLTDALCLLVKMIYYLRANRRMAAVRTPTRSFDLPQYVGFDRVTMKA